MRVQSILTLAVALAVPVTSGAALFDGKSNVVCASLEAVQCASEPGRGHVCARGIASGLNVPQFVKLDFGAREVTATEESGITKTSTISSVTQANGNLVVQGVDDGHGWTMVLDENSGHMTASAIGHTEGVLVFGACTPL